MGYFDKYNGGKRFEFEMEGTPVFKKLSELYSENVKGFVFPVRSVYINKKSKFGDSPVIVSDKFSVNLPSRLLHNVEELLTDDEFYDMVNNGRVGFTVNEFENHTYNSKGYSIDWIEYKLPF